MPSIKIHLESAEYNVVSRLAAELKVQPGAIAYAALNRLMLDVQSPAVKIGVVETWAWHRQNLPHRSDSACSVYAYQEKGDDQPTPSRYLP